MRDRPTQVRADTSSGVHLAEIVASIAVASDLGLGQPLDHLVRSCVIADRVAVHLGASREDRDATYWVTLFQAAGCIGVSFEMASLFGDDIAFRAGTYTVQPTTYHFLRYVMRRAGGDGSALHRARVRAELVGTAMSSVSASLVAHCAVSAELARQLTLGDLVVRSLQQIFEQWNGRGVPNRLRGAQVLLPIRIANLATLVEVHDRAGGVPATVEAARAARPTIGPDVADGWCAIAAEVLADADADSSWHRVIAAQPPGRGVLTNGELDAALELFADYADLKSPWLTGHSRGVASLAVAAGRELGLPDEELTVLRRAALVHDIGRIGVPNTIWDKPSTLTESESERVRLHAYYTDRVLHRAGRLARLGAIASAAHERQDGSGYPRSVAGGTAPLLSRLLAVADVYHALLEERPHRPAWSRGAAERELRRAAGAGELDPTAVDATLAAAGHAVRRRPAAPAGLTTRELQVLALVARGKTTKAIGRALGITTKTAGNHVERIYQKAGVSTRAEAAMFAMRHGVVPTWDTDEA